MGCRTGCRGVILDPVLQYRGIDESYLRSRRASLAARRSRAAAARNGHEATLWGAHAASAYVEAVDELADGLAAVVADARAISPALVALSAHLSTLVGGAGFGVLREHAGRVEAALAAVRFAVWVRGAKVTVAPVGDEQDLQRQVLTTFARFRQSGAGAAGRRPVEGPRAVPG